MVYYPKPLHIQKAFEGIGYKPENFPVALEASERIFSLPIHGYLTDDEIKMIVESLSDND